MDQHFIIFDTETTGLPGPDATPLAKQPQIIEYAGIKVNWATLEELDRLTFFANPGVPLPAKITEITGLTDADLKDEPPFVANYPALVDFHLGTRGLCAHNLAFDCSLLRFELMRLDAQCRFPWSPENVCTVEASKSIKGHRLHLSDIHTMATGAPHKGAHRAMVDTEALLNVVVWMREQGLL